MTTVALNKDDQTKFIRAMLDEGTVYGPVADKRGTVLGMLSEMSTLELAFDNFKLPLKRLFFPQCEVLSRWDDMGGMVEEPGSGDTTVIFGARPCDTQSLTQLDKVFSDEKFTDPYYENRRSATLIISLACSSPATTCFCTSTSGGPAATAGTDILTYSLDRAFLLKSVSEKGAAFLAKNSVLFRVPTADELKSAGEQEAAAEAMLSTFHVSGVPEKLGKEIDFQFWDTIAQTCLSCGACAFLCPTCHCFDLHDENMKDGGVRVRVHDTCMFGSFVREASGHNPRSKAGLRMKQRVMHKFSYTSDNFGEIFCVGCGRCVNNCPSGIDIRETISKVTA